MTVPDTVARELLLRAVPGPVAEPFEGWDDVLRRSDIDPTRARRTVRRALVFAAALLGVVLLVAPAVGVGSRLVGLVWNDGTTVEPAALGEMDSWLLDDQVGEGRAVKQIASDGKLAFYVVRGADGQSCLASGAVGAKVRFGSLGCGPGSFERLLPSAEDPIYLEAAGELRPPGEFELVGVVGMAAGGVSRVALVDADEKTLLSAPVTDHVFQLPLDPPVAYAAVAAIVAFDENGDEVYREGLRGS